MNRILSIQRLLNLVSVCFFFLLSVPIIVALYPLQEIDNIQISYVLRHFTSPFITTLILGLLTGVGAVVLGTLSVVCVCLLRSRQLKLLFAFLVSLPLIFPPYIGAISYIDIFKSSWGLSLFGKSEGIELIQAVFVLSLFLYPYVFFILYSRIRMIDPAHLKIVALYKLSTFQKIKYIFLPHIKTALLSGFLMTFSYVVADFGAVSILRMNTLTTELYQEVIRKFGYAEGAFVSLILLSLTFVVMSIGRKVVGPSVKTSRKLAEISFPLVSFKSQIIIVISMVILVLFSLGVPLGKIISWYIHYLGETSGLKDVWVPSHNYPAASITSILLAFMTVCVTQSLVLLLLVIQTNVTKVVTVYTYISTLLYSLPGIVIAFSIVIMKFSLPGGNSLAFVFLLLAYIYRYFGIAFLTISPGMALIPYTVRKIGHTFISSRIEYAQQIIYPYIREYLLQSSNYVYFHALRELTIPLLLLPLGMNILPVRIWQTASEGLYVYAAPGILILILLSLPSVLWYIRDHL